MTTPVPSTRSSDTGPAWAEVKRLAADALELPRGERRAFVEERTSADLPLRERVIALIAADEEQGDAALSADGLEGPRVVLREFDSAGPLEAGEQVGRYRIVRHIGAGGMGAVYEARDDELGRDVAIKVIVGAGVGLAWSTSALRRFSAEAKALARLAHPGIAQIFESGTHRLKGGVFAPYFVLELVRGGVPITAWARESSRTLREKVGLFVRVCDSVAHGHQKGVIHRDLKPANILIDLSGDPKLIDFGVARTVEGDDRTRAMHATRMTREGQIVGTIQYMSPEQCTGDGQDVDVRSDVYSLGVVLHEILSGELPYDVRTATLVAAASIIRDQPPRPLGQMSREMSGDLERIVLRTLAKTPEGRYQGAGELAGDLRRWLDGEAILARAPSAVYQIKMFARRHKALVAGVLIAVACLSLGVVGTSIGLVQARRAQRLADEQSQRATRLSTFILGIIRSANPSPSPTRADTTPPDPITDWFTEGRVVQSAGLPGHVATTSELLADAVRRVTEEFADDPLLMADAASEVLSTMNALGLNVGENGRKLLRDVPAIYERELSISNRKTIVANFSAALQFGVLGSTNIATDHMRKALEGATLLLGPTDPRTATIHRLLALQIAHDGSRRAEAMAELDALRTRIAGDVGETSVDVAEIDVARAEVLSRDNRDQEALAITRDAVAYLRGANRPRSLLTALAQIATLASSRFESMNEAEAAAAEAVAIADRIDPLGGLSNEHRYRHMVILLSLQRYEEAERIARAALAVYERLLPEDGLNRLKAQARVVSILIRRRANLDEALALARVAAEGYERAAGQQDEDYTQHHYSLLAAVLRLRGDPVGALAIVEPRLEARRTHNVEWERNWASVSLLLERGRCLTALHRYEEAEKDLTIAARICEAMYSNSPTFPTWSALGDAMVTLYTQWGRPEQAEPWRKIADPMGNARK